MCGRCRLRLLRGLRPVRRALERVRVPLVEAHRSLQASSLQGKGMRREEDGRVAGDGLQEGISRSW